MLAPTPTTEHDYVRSRFAWPEAKIALFKELWAQLPELSANQIGLRLGVTRCAVLGKRKRLGLPNRVIGSQRRATGDSRRPSKRAIALRPEGAPRAKSRRWSPLVQCDGYTDIPPDHSDCAVPFLEIREGQCRYPVAPDGQPFLFCAAPAVDTYCPRHDRLCHRYTGPARSWHEGRRERAAG